MASKIKSFKKIVLFFVAAILFGLNFYTANAAKGQVDEGYYIIESVLDRNKVLDINGASKDNGANLQIWRKNGSPAQTFQIKKAKNGYYTITAVCSGKVLDVAGGKKVAGTNVQQYKSNSSDAQMWKFEHVKDDIFIINSKLGNFCLDVAGGKTDNGTNVLIWNKSKDKRNQQFRFKKVDVSQNANNEDLNDRLIDCVCKDDLEGCKDCVAKGADVVNAYDGCFGYNPLQNAVYRGYEDICEWLIDQMHVDVNAVSPYGLKGAPVPAQLAVMRGHLNLCSLLINKGAKVDIKDLEGYTVLYYLSQFKPDEVREILSKIDINSINSESKDDLVRLQWGAMKDYDDMKKWLDENKDSDFDAELAKEAILGAWVNKLSPEEVDKEIEKQKSIYLNRAPDVFVFNNELINKIDHKILLVSLTKINQLFDKYDIFTKKFIEYKRKNNEKFELKLCDEDSLTIMVTVGTSYIEFSKKHLNNYMASFYRKFTEQISGYKSKCDANQVLLHSITHEFGHLVEGFFEKINNTDNKPNNKRSDKVIKLSELYEKRHEYEKKCDELGAKYDELYKKNDGRMHSAYTEWDNAANELHNIRAEIEKLKKEIDVIEYPLEYEIQDKILEGLEGEARQISEYGNTNASEFFAEAFAHLECTESPDNVNEIGKRLENYLVNIMKFLPKEKSKFNK